MAIATLKDFSMAISTSKGRLSGPEDTRFLSGDEVWAAVAVGAKRAERAMVAVAYLGSNASQLLPLKRGDELLVDLSMHAVRSGVTNPHEVKRYLDKGVVVFTRASLHAKFFIFDDTLIVGSNNVSTRSRDILDEAAILTTKPQALRSAVRTFRRFCTEPVRIEYLTRCLKVFRPPKGSSAEGVVHRTKLWIVGNLQQVDVPANEREDARRLISEAQSTLHDFQRCHVDDCHFPSERDFFSKLKVGDWQIHCVRSSTRYDVYSPVRFLALRSYARGGGRRRWLLLSEAPNGIEQIPWSTFRSAARHLGVELGTAPRTQAVPSQVQADALLSLWDRSGSYIGLA